MLVKYRPMSSFLSPFFDEFWSPSLTDRECYLSPRTDILERKNDYVIYAEMPGVSQDSFKVEVEDNLLTISGTKGIHQKEDGEQFYRTERTCGDYRRSFRLGDEIDTTKVSAKYQDGVLEVVLPKAQKAKPKNIEIKVN